MPESDKMFSAVNQQGRNWWIKKLEREAEEKCWWFCYTPTDNEGNVIPRASKPPDCLEGLPFHVLHPMVGFNLKTQKWS